jgi:hypothetical protein
MLKSNGGAASVAPADTNGGIAAPPSSTMETETTSSRRSRHRAAKPTLDVKASASWRDQLLAEMANLASADEMITWAQHSLALKNTLTGTDARLVEEAFETKIKGFDDLQDAPSKPPAASINETQADAAPGARSEPGEATRAGSIDHQRAGSKGGSEAALPGLQHSAPLHSTAAETTDGSGNTADLARISSGDARGARPVPARSRRVRNKEHLDFVASLPCLVCGRQPCDPHHLRFVQPRALGRKVSDEFTVPLCRIHHRELHRQANEEAWWSLVNIDPKAAALSLWQRTRGLLVPAVATETQQTGATPQ